MAGLADVARAGDGHLEGVDVESLVVGVSQETDEVMLLEALGVVFVLDVGTRCLGVPVIKYNFTLHVLSICT